MIVYLMQLFIYKLLKKFKRNLKKKMFHLKNCLDFETLETMECCGRELTFEFLHNLHDEK